MNQNETRKYSSRLARYTARVFLVLFVSLLLCPTVKAGDKKKWRQFKVDFLKNVQKLREREADLETIKSYDTEDAVELLFVAYESFYFDYAGKPVRKPAPMHRDYLDHYPEVLASFQSEDAMKAIMKEGFKSKKWYNKVLASDALGLKGDAAYLKPLHEMIASSKTGYAQLLSAIRAVRRINDQSSVVVLAELADRESRWEVQLRILLAFKQLDASQAIPVMIKLLASGSKRIRAEAQQALIRSSGQNFHQNYRMWLAWYEENREAIDNGTLVKGDKVVEGPISSEAYYGMPIDSDRVIFIIDSSGSMADPYKIAGSDTVTSGDDDKHKPKGDTKLDIVKDELIHAVRQLDSTTHFTIVVYSSNVRVWKPHPVQATKSNKKLAISYVKGLSPSGETNIYDAVETAMAMAKGLEATQGKFHTPITGEGGAAVDTIFLLSDGMPNAGKIPNAADILPAVRELNDRFEIKINTIFVGKIDNSFMKDMADQNHGQYVRY